MADLGDVDDAIMDAAGYHYETQPTGADGRYIRDRLMPEFWEQFASKAKDYNDIDGFEPHKVLGIRGQFAEVWRKVWKLKNTLWDGRTLAYEGEREILLDMIGHCFLAISMIDRADGGKPYGTPVLATSDPTKGTEYGPTTYAESGMRPEPERLLRPDGSVETLARGAGDQPWPMCGREKCVNCTKATLRTVLQSTNARIIQAGATHRHDCPCYECEAGHA